MIEITKQFKFSASHILPKHPGKCRLLHGHNWVLEVTLSGEVDPDSGFVMDYAELSEIMEPLIISLDHHHLGTWDHDWLPYNQEWDAGTPEGFYPSSENLVLWIAERLSACYEPGPKWSKLVLHETDTCSCMLTREEYDRTARNGRGNLEQAQSSR